MDSLDSQVLSWNGVVLLVIALVTTLTNGALLITVYRDPLRCFRNTGAAFIVCLAVTDFMTGAVTASNVGVFSILNSQGIPSLKIGGVLQEKIVSQFTVRSGILVVTAFSFERFTAVAFPIFHRKNVTYKTVKNCALGCCPFVLMTSLMEVVVDRTVFDNITYYGFFIIPLLLISMSYLATYIAFRVKLRGIINNTNVMPIASQEEKYREVRQLKREKLLSQTAFYVIIGFMFSFSPWFSMVAITTYCKPCIKSSWYFAMYRSSIPFLYVNSALNPLLYAWRIPKYRQSVVKMFTKLKLHPENKQ